MKKHGGVRDIPGGISSVHRSEQEYQHKRNAGSPEGSRKCHQPESFKKILDHFSIWNFIMAALPIEVGAQEADVISVLGGLASGVEQSDCGNGGETGARVLDVSLYRYETWGRPHLEPAWIARQLEGVPKVQLPVRLLESSQ